MELGAGLTPIIASASIWLLFRTLKDQQFEIKQNILRFEVQQFESKFFQLLKTQNEMRQSLSFNFHSLIIVEQKLIIKHSSIKSVEVFKYAYTELKNIAQATNVEVQEFNLEQINEKIEEVYLDLKDRNHTAPTSEENYDIETYLISERDKYASSFYAYSYSLNPLNFREIPELNKWRRISAVFIRKHFDCFDVYFSHLYSIVNFIEKTWNSPTEMSFEESNTPDNKLKDYITFLVSQMSQNELSLLFYYSLLYKKHGRLFMKYGIFNGLIKEKLIEKDHTKLMKGLKLKGITEHFEI